MIVITYRDGSQCRATGLFLEPFSEPQRFIVLSVSPKCSDSYGSRVPAYEITGLSIEETA